MDNNEIRALLNDAHNIFFHKWRDRVPEPDSEKWEDVLCDVCGLLKKYEGNERAKKMILWFLDELDERSRRGSVKEKTDGKS